MDLKEYLTSKRQLIEKKLDLMVPENKSIPVISEAMRYSLLAGGKRLRPILAIMSCELFEGREEEVLPFACCIELIHTYSLIHDDLPAMDNDNLRRGKPTNHKVFGEGFAVLAGDALLNHAFETMTAIIMKNPKPEYIRAMDVISRASGLLGMIGGQSIDLYYESKCIDFDTLKSMHEKDRSADYGISCIRCDHFRSRGRRHKNIMEYGNIIGLAFQVADDILDVSGSEKSWEKHKQRY